MASHAVRAKKALDDGNYEAAIEAYTAAIKESPTSPDYYIQRSTAHQRAKEFNSALEDAEQAVLNAQKRAKKELITEAQFRRGIALYSLGRYADAEFILQVVRQRNPDHKQAPMWISKATQAMKDFPEDDTRRQCTIKETPTPTTANKPQAADDSKHANTATAPDTAEGRAPAAPLPQQTPANKIRYDWYQNSEKVFFTLLAKGVPQDKAVIDISQRSLNISFPLALGSSYDLTLEPLYGAVLADQSSTRILPSKVEISLAKAVPGQKWLALESSEPVPSGEVTGAESAATKPTVLAETTSAATAPSYPTSSKSGPKDWDRITREQLRTAKAGDDKSGAAAEDDDDDFEGGDAANSFFKKLFKDASPEVQRAMMKSYTESNGTALSTNWEDVKKGKVETVPPDGMEAKKW